MEDEIKALQATAAAHRGHVTRASKELDRIAQSVDAHPSERSVKSLLQALERFEQQSAKAEGAYERLIDIDQDKD